MISFSKKSHLYITVLLLLVVGCFVSCKETVLENLPPRHRTYMHFINLHPDFQGVDMKMSSFETTEYLFKNVQYAETWPMSGYSSLLTLQNTDSTSLVKFSLLKTGTIDTILGERSLTLFKERASTLILIKTVDSTTLLVKTLDQMPTPTDSTGNVRVMNFSPDVISASLNTLDRRDSIENISYLSYTGFRPFRKGTRTLMIYDNTGPTLLDSIPNFQILQNRNYAFYVYKDAVSGMNKVLWEEVRK